MSFIPGITKIPVFILDATTQQDKVVFCNTSILAKSHAFFQLTPTCFWRMTIPKHITGFASLIIVHHNGNYPEIHPISSEGAYKLKEVSFTKHVVNHAINDKGEVRRPIYQPPCNYKKSRLSS